MKNSSQIFTIILLFLSFTVTSQNARPISELLVELSKNHMGSVTEVFSLEEIQIIKDHFVQTTFPPNTEYSVVNRRFSSSESVATPINAVDIDRNDISIVESLGVSPLNEFPGAGASLRNIDGTNRALIIDNNNRGWTRNFGPTPIVYQDLGNFTGVIPGQSITGIEVLSGPMAEIYGVSTNGVDDSRLVTIDVVSRTVTTIGDNNGLILPIALARDKNNNLITIDIDDDSVYGMDKTTGAATLIGPLGTNADFGQAFFFDEGNDQLTSLAYNPMIGDSEVRTVNPITGLSTSLGTIQPGTVQQFGWGTSYDRDLLGIVVPEIDGFSLYPNPAKNTITLTGNNSIETIEIYSILGSLLKKQTVGNRTISIDINELPSGAYILSATTANQTETYKFIKQ